VIVIQRVPGDGSGSAEVTRAGRLGTETTDDRRAMDGRSVMPAHTRPTVPILRATACRGYARRSSPEKHVLTWAVDPNGAALLLEEEARGRRTVRYRSVNVEIALRSEGEK